MVQILLLRVWKFVPNPPIFELLSVLECDSNSAVSSCKWVNRPGIMPQITKKLLRKRAEHNEGLLSTLEEISLHQEEIEQINEVSKMISSINGLFITLFNSHKSFTH